MSRKGWIISAVVGLLIAIGIGSTFVFSSGKGEVMELSPLEMKKFMSEDGTGFVILNNDKKTREDILFKVEKLAKQNDIQVRELFGGERMFQEQVISMTSACHKNVIPLLTMKKES